MSSANSPFEDPEFLAEIARAGMTHRPGMADELMRQIAPLLAADGIDLDDPDADFDEDDLQAALDRATERYNLELVTPIGHKRDLAVGLLRACAIAIAEERLDDAQTLLTFSSPKGGEDHPTIAHVLGAGIGLLETWFADAQLLPLIRAARATKWTRPVRSAANDLLALAAKGRAFASLNSLLLRPGGLVLQQATVLGLAACLRSVMSREQLDAEQAAERCFGDEGANWQAPASPPPVSAATPEDDSRLNIDGFAGAQRTGLAFGLGKRDGISTASLRRFGQWIDADLTPLFTMAESTEQILEQFEQLASIAAQLRIDLDEPEDIESMLDVIDEFRDDEVRMNAFDLLHDYIHFRLDTDPDPEIWQDAHELIEDAIDEGNPVPLELYEAIERADQIDPALRVDALAHTRVVAAVPELLAWLGKSQGVSPSGGVRRADIATVAAMIGVRAEGVAKTVEHEQHLSLDIDMSAPLPEPEIQYARSSLEVPALSAWWGALQQADLITRTGTRMRPGPAAASWPATGAPPYETADLLVMVYIAEILIEGVLDTEWSYSMPVMIEAVARLISAVVEEESEEMPTSLFTPQALQRLAKLEQMGILEVLDGVVTVPPPLRGTVGRAIMASMALAAQV